ncbi:MAG: hypothetical protein NE330_12205 [Lentisphaeraceae bacterium]|nr:hypothetical protein [Lentisphaeraceae bacterium]
MFKRPLCLFSIILMLGGSIFAESQGRQVSESGIRHSFLLTGNKTCIFGEDNSIVWEVPGKSRDGYVLENGNILIAFAKEVKEFTRDKKVVFQYKVEKPNGEISTAVRLKNGNTMITELGKKPRLIEVSAEGEIVVEVALQPETTNQHLQTRMARKLKNGNYLVPHLLAYAVKEYDPTGKVVNVIKTDLPELGGRKLKSWPFTAVRLENGNTLVNLTLSHRTVEFGPTGQVVWKSDNKSTGNKYKDACGLHQLANGNRVITNHQQRDKTKVQIFEVDPSGKVIWEFFHPKVTPHEIHILTTNGKKETSLLR